MRRLIALAVVALSALAAPKDSGTTTLKDVQPAGTPDKKQKQQYDLFFVSSTGKDITCRTPENKSVKATDLVVGSTVNYKIEEEKAKLKTSAGKEFSCVIVRVANAAANAAKSGFFLPLPYASRFCGRANADPSAPKSRTPSRAPCSAIC